MADGYFRDEDDSCIFCGYEPESPYGIYSEVLGAYVCLTCEPIAVRVLTSAAETGHFQVGSLVFAVTRLDTK